MKLSRVQSQEIGGCVSHVSLEPLDVQPTIAQAVQDVIGIGRPPLPVAPKQDPRKEGCHAIGFGVVRFKKRDPKRPEIQGNCCRISNTKVGDYSAPVKGDYCRLDENCEPINRSTGKNPSQLDRRGKFFTIQHAKYQDRMPWRSEVGQWWYAGSPNGLFVLGGGPDNIVILDFDVKNYASQEACDQAVKRVLRLIGQDTWVERTGSGGYRVFVSVEEKPSFTNFDTDPNGDTHRGEALGDGRGAVVAPTIHPNGNPYLRISFARPARVQSLQAIGIYPTKAEQCNQERKSLRIASSKKAQGFKQTDPLDNAWDIRNFADFLEGSHLDGDWIKARCPHHLGNSDNSLSINAASGKFHCWGGCDNSSVYKAAMEAAVAGGYKLPSKKPGKRKKQQRDKLIADRMSKFCEYWNELKRNFQMSKADVEYEGFCPPLDLTRSRTFLVQGGLGAGKSEAMIRAIAKVQNEVVVWLTVRNGLLSQTGERLKKSGIKHESVLHYQSDVPAIRDQLILDTAGRSIGGTTVYTMCVDSLKNYSTGGIDLSNCIIVIDEFSSVRKTIHQKHESFPEFERIMREAKILIVADAFLSDADRAVIKRYRGRDRINYRQKFKQSPVKIRWVETLTKPKSKEEEPCISFSHESIYQTLFDQLAEQRTDNGLIAVSADNKLIAKIAADHFKEKGLRVLLCCRDTVESNKIFLKNPDEVLTNYDVVIYTPTAESGLDVQIPVDAGLFLYSNVVDPLSVLQMVGRCRQCPVWTISAPRFAIGGTPAPLGGEGATKLGKHFSELFDELGISTEAGAASWQQWDENVSEISKAYGSEFLQKLLNHFFANVETVFIEPTAHKTRWCDECKRVKNDEARSTLKANLAKGQALKESQKAPSTDSEVWDIALAALYGKMPDLTQLAIDVLPKAEEDLAEAVHPEDKKSAQSMLDDILGLGRELRSSRLEKLKQWRLAQNPQAADNHLERLQVAAFLATNSRNFKQYSNLRLYQGLRLERELAKVAPQYDDRGNVSYPVTPNETGFSPESPIVAKLWRQFCRDVELRKLFPTATSIEVFWHLCCRCMSAMGFQSKGKAIRVKTQERHANGKGRSGETRYVNSKTVYFAAWLIQCCSGSKVFQKYFDKIVVGLDDWIARDEERRTDFKRRRSEREAIAA